MNNSIGHSNFYNLSVMREVVLNLLLVVAVVVIAALLWPLVAGLSIVGIAIFLIASAIGISLSFAKIKKKRRYK